MAMPASWHGSSVDRQMGIWCPAVRLAACALVFGPKLARARTSAGDSPSVTVPQHEHCLACATCPVTFGPGTGAMSVT
jgi:hypothetical protein